MPKGVSLHIGLNFVDPNHYAGWDGELVACEADAQDMNALAQFRKYTPKLLLTKDATRGKVESEIKAAANQLVSGDIFFLSYSGHGGQLPDINGDEEGDGLDETWCLYDGEMIDDEIFSLLGAFKEGVRIISLSDSCHSGSVLRAAYGYTPSRARPTGDSSKSTRAIPWNVARRVYRDNKAFYDKIASKPGLKEAKDNVVASAILISGCQDNQVSQDGAFNGLFTGTLLSVWANGSFAGGYKKFHKSIVKRMPPDQTPNFFTLGKKNPAFEKQKPFLI